MTRPSAVQRPYLLMLLLLLNPGVLGYRLRQSGWKCENHQHHVDVAENGMDTNVTTESSPFIPFDNGSWGIDHDGDNEDMDVEAQFENGTLAPVDLDSLPKFRPEHNDKSHNTTAPSNPYNGVPPASTEGSNEEDEDLETTDTLMVNGTLQPIDLESLPEFRPEYND